MLAALWVVAPPQLDFDTAVFGASPASAQQAGGNGNNGNGPGGGNNGNGVGNNGNNGNGPGGGNNGNGVGNNGNNGNGPGGGNNGNGVGNTGGGDDDAGDAGATGGVGGGTIGGGFGGGINVGGPTTGGPSVAGPSTGSPSVAGPSIGNPSVAGPSSPSPSSPVSPSSPSSPRSPASPDLPGGDERGLGRGAPGDSGESQAVAGADSAAPARTLVDAIMALTAPPPPPVPPLVPWASDGNSRDGDVVIGGVEVQNIGPLSRRGYLATEFAPNPAIGVPVVRIQAPAGTTLAEARADVAGILDSPIVDVNHVYLPAQAPCVGPACTPREVVGWPAATGNGATCGAGAVIGLVDTGVDTSHSAFAGQDVEIIETGVAGTAANADHGTAVAALMVGSPIGPVRGFVPSAKLLSATPFSRDASGQDSTDAFEIAVAIDRLVARGVGVINLSLSGPPNRIVEQVIRAANAAGVVLVAAAGNGGPAASPAYPAAYDGVIAVTAVDSELRSYRRAQQGSYVDLAAPGVAVESAVQGNRIAAKTGTSFAVPFVTSASALLKLGQPSATGAVAREQLGQTAADLGPSGRDPIFGFGLLQDSPDCAPPATAGRSVATEPRG